jgi:hypothetical protein
MYLGRRLADLDAELENFAVDPRRAPERVGGVHLPSQITSLAINRRPYGSRTPAVDRKQSRPTRPLATKNVQLVTKGEVLQFQNGPTAESASKNRDDGTPKLMHAGDTTADHRKTLDFSALSEFLVATGFEVHWRRRAEFLRVMPI